MLYHDLLDVDWSYVFSAQIVRDKWDVFLSFFVPVFNAHAPIKRVSFRNPTAPPVSDATRDFMSQRRAALHSGCNSSDYKNLNRYVHSGRGATRPAGGAAEGNRGA